MINAVQAQKYCCEDVNLIENYEAAVNDTTQTWACHHRLEITDSGVIGMTELKARGLYYKRPANELIFLTKFEHNKLHGINCSDETRAKISASLKGRESNFKGKHHTTETKQKNREAHIGKRHTEESKTKMSAAHKGMRPTEESKTKMSAARKGNKNPMYGSRRLWYNNGSTSIRVIEGEQPDGFVRGRI